MLTSLTLGVGLTLTRASHVVHFDRGWNTAVENQATDRTHRIGQKKVVCVHILETTDTFEPKVAARLAEKSRLANLVVEKSENFLADLSDQQLLELFKLSDDVGLSVETPQPAEKRRRVLDTPASATTADSSDERLTSTPPTPIMADSVAPSLAQLLDEDEQMTPVS